MKELIEHKYKDEDYFYYLYEMNDEYLWYATLKKPNTELNILQTEFDNFFNYALIRLLRFYNLMLHERNQNNVDYRLTMFKEILNYISNEQTEEIPAILVFKTILLLLHTKEKKYYIQLKKLKEKYLNEFRFDDQHLIYIHIYDFAAYMVNFKGDDAYNYDMFEIYKELIEKNLMTKDSFLYPNFMNVVKVACRVGEYEFAENFINEFRVSIPETEKENVLEFCYGIIEIAKKNYKKALTHLSKTNFQNFIFKVQVKILLLKTYYKLEMHEQALGMIDSFRHYVSREESLLKEHKESYNKFLILVSDLIKVKESYSKDKSFEFERIKKETDLIPANPFRIKAWLLEEISKS